MEVVKRRRDLREKIIEEAKDWSAKLPLKLTAILIGSYARGDFNLWSDVDIMLISEDFTGGPIQRLKPLDILPGYQVIPLTPNEFRSLLARKNPLATDVIEHGIVLRDDLGVRQIPRLKAYDSAARVSP